MIKGYQGYQLCIFVWTLFAVSTIFVTIRLCVQFHLRYRPWREIFIILAWLLYLGNSICTSLLVDIDFYNEESAPPEGATYAEVRQYWEPSNKLHVAGSFFWKPSIYFCKCALLVFFGELTPRHVFPKIWWTIVITWALVIIGIACNTFGQFFTCWPFSKMWETEDACSYRTPLTLTNMLFHLFTDLLAYGIPMVIVFNLPNLTGRQRLNVCFMFLVGGMSVGFAIITAISRALPNYGLVGRSDYANLFSAIDWGHDIQQATAVIVTCMPQVRRFYQLLCVEQRNKNAHTALPEDNLGDMAASNHNPPVVDLEAAAGSESLSQSSSNKEHDGEIENIPNNLTNSRVYEEKNTGTTNNGGN